MKKEKKEAKIVNDIIMGFSWRALVLVLVVVATVERRDARLAQNFYASSCPNLDRIVRNSVQIKFSKTFRTVSATLRLFFHDCFVEGCDASVMIESPNGDAEKNAPDNLSLAVDGFDTIVEAKQAVENDCPGIVSCADILALATRDVIFLAGGPQYAVELGRRDGLISQASSVAGNLPGPSFNLNNLTTMFAAHDLSLVDMIALSGAHTLGFTHCGPFASRLYSFSPSSPVDPSLDSTYARKLMQVCPPNADPSVVIGMDLRTPRTFDNAYYRNLVDGKGLFTSDQVLFEESKSQQAVRTFATNPAVFNSAFIMAITKLGRVGVKTGIEGEIRRDCSAFNS